MFCLLATNLELMEMMVGNLIQQKVSHRVCGNNQLRL